MRSPADAVGIGKFLPPPQGEGDHEVVVGVSHRRNAGDGVPYGFTKMPTESVGAGLPDGPPMPNGIGKKPPLCGGDFSKMCNKIRRGDKLSKNALSHENVGASIARPPKIFDFRIF